MRHHIRIVLVGALIHLAQYSSVSLQSASAEPYLSLRTGFKCSQCHVNKSGGGMRTNYGLIYSQVNLPIKPLRSSSFVSGRLNRLASVGANFRAENVSLFSYENPEGEMTDVSNSSRIPEANIYFSFELIPDNFRIYVDQSLAPNSGNREFFGLIQAPSQVVYLKVGRMLLPYGIRLRDNEAFIRNETGFTYSRSELGVEVGVEPGPYSLIASVTNTQISAVAQTVYSRFRFGGTVSKNIDGTDDYKIGAFAGAGLGRFALLAEGDFINQGGLERFAALAELSILIRRGFNVRAVYEFFDRNRDVANARDAQERISFGVEPFLTPFLQVGVFYRINGFVPQNLQQNQNQLLIQFHVFF